MCVYWHRIIPLVIPYDPNIVSSACVVWHRHTVSFVRRDDPLAGYRICFGLCAHDIPSADLSFIIHRHLRVSAVDKIYCKYGTQATIAVYEFHNQLYIALCFIKSCNNYIQKPMIRWQKKSFYLICDEIMVIYIYWNITAMTQVIPRRSRFRVNYIKSDKNNIIFVVVRVDVMLCLSVGSFSSCKKKLCRSF